MMTREPKQDAALTAEVAASLAIIRADFVDGLVPLFNEVEYQKAALGDPNRADHALASLQRVVHKLSGLSGSVGFPDLGAHASTLDISIAEIRRGQDTSGAGAALDAPLETLLDLMESALDAAL